MTPDLLPQTYGTYVAISVLLTVWTGRTLYRGGRTFLVDVFHGKEALADSVNRLLVVGFYLLNFGFVCFNLRLGSHVTSVGEAFEALASKVGLVLFVLGGLHFFNLFWLSRARKAAVLEDAPPPFAPDATVAFPRA